MTSVLPLTCIHLLTPDWFVVREAGRRGGGGELAHMCFSHGLKSPHQVAKSREIICKHLIYCKPLIYCDTQPVKTSRAGVELAG